MWIYLAWLALASVVASALFWWLFFRNANNEFAPGAEIEEDELAEAIQPEMLQFIREQNEVAR